jgi:hypothetical protein
MTAPTMRATIKAWNENPHSRLILREIARRIKKSIIFIALLICIFLFMEITFYKLYFKLYRKLMNVFNIIFPLLPCIPFKYSNYYCNDGSSCCQTRNEIKTPIPTGEDRQVQPLLGAKVIQVLDKKITSTDSPIGEREYKSLLHAGSGKTFREISDHTVRKIKRIVYPFLNYLEDIICSGLLLRY